MAIGTPTNVQTAANTSSTTAVITSYASGSESGRTLIVVGTMLSFTANRTLTCTFGASSLTEESTQLHALGADNFRTSVFRLRNVSGTQNITLTASAATDGIGVIAYYIDGVDDADVEATAGASDTSSPHTVTISSGVTTGALVAYGMEAAPDDDTLAGLTPSGLTEAGDIEINSEFQNRMGSGWEEATGSSESGGWSTGETLYAAPLAAASFAAASAGTNTTITANQGSYILSGQTAGLLSALNITAVQGSYTLSGQANTTSHGRTITAEQGSYTLTGQDATFLRAITLTATQGSYTLTGQDTTLSQALNAILEASKGTYFYSGSDVGFRKVHTESMYLPRRFQRWL